MLSFIRYLRGFVSIRVQGFSPERFINLCGNKKILLWNIRKEENTYYMNISLKDFFLLRPIVKKTRTKVAVLQRCGLPFFVPGLLARKIFLSGLLMTLIFWWSSTLFVWEISVSGNHNITEDHMLQFLKENYVYIGMQKKDMNIKEIEKELRKEYDVITWVSLKMDGTKLLISVKENQILQSNENDKAEYSPVSNLVSDIDGTIISMIVRSGIPNVTIGQEIKAGDVLISGSIPIYNEDGTIRKFQYTKSDADILAEHRLNIKESIPFSYIKKAYTGREMQHYYIGINEKILNIFPPKVSYPYYDIISVQKRISILPNMYLPLFGGRYLYRDYLKIEHVYSLEEAVALLNEKYAQILVDLEEKGVQIIEKDVRIDTESGKWILEGTLTVISKIGIEEEIINE